MSVKTYHLVEVDEPHPLVARALNADLWTRCRIENPVPVHFVPMPRWGGVCPDVRDTLEGEIRIADDLLVDNPSSKDVDKLVHVYLHEFSHRLAPGQNHNAAFFAVNALLLIRSGSDRCSRSRLEDMDLYDLQDWEDIPNCQIGEALDWALALARELADKDISAEVAAREIVARHEKWKAWKAGRPEREAKAKAARAAERAADVNLIHELRGDRWRWAFAALFLGFTLAAALFINK